MKTTLWIAVLGAMAITPFGLNNLLHSRWLLGTVSLTVVSILIMLAWLSYQGRYSNVSLLLLPPVVGFLALSVHQQEIIGVMWSYPAVLCFYFMFRERWAWAANVATLVAVVPVAFSVLEPWMAMRAAVTLGLISVFAVLAVRVISIQQRRLEVLVITDPLTGLFARNLVHSSLDHAISRYRRFEETATLLAVDVDFFRHINETYGHSVGDDVLVGVANILRNRLRATDLVFRSSSEEFTVLLPDTRTESAVHVAQLLRSTVAGSNLIDTHPVTISIGVSELRDDDTSRSWMSRADQCLYEANRAGRNRVESDTALLPQVGQTQTM